MNQVNEMWPLMTTVQDNGYAGVQINPRWATNIYYNCHTPSCTVAEWVNTNVGVSGDFYTLLGIEKNANTRHLLGLHHDPFMFHQANLNYGTAAQVTINGVTQKRSLFQSWVETIVQETIRLVNWPVISLKHDDMAASFKARMVRDGCGASLTYTTTSTSVTSVTLTTTGNTCAAKIPVTVPGSVTNLQGFGTEKIGSDSLTIWVQMSGAPVTFILTTPVPL